MRLRSSILIPALCAAPWLPPAGTGLLFAQGITTAAIRGTVRTPDGNDADGTRVTVVNTANGFVTQGAVRHGRFLVLGLESGGPYAVSLRRIGFHPQDREGVYLRLGEPLELHFVLEPLAATLDPVRITGTAFSGVNAHGGTGTAVSDSLLHRLPTLNRDLYDFVRLAPQVSTKVGFAGGGMSGGGVGFRFNSFLINGVPQRSIGGHVPPERAGARSVPFEAVREYQILLAPFDVRYGDFAGALVNAVTRSGTNRIQGSAFAHGRSDALARRGEGAAGAPYERLQYGLSLGGPVRRDRLHYFVATDLQHFTSPSPGPYVGQPAGARQPVPVSAADLARLEEILRGYGLASGSGGPVENSNPLRSLFGRLDLALPEWNSRAVLWVNDTRARDLNFSRAALDSFPLSTYAATQVTAVRNAALELHSGTGRAFEGGHNQLLASYRSAGSRPRPGVHQPLVGVAVPSTTGGTVTVITGTPPSAQGTGTGGRAVSVRDDLTLPLGASHVATIGLEAEWFQANRGAVSNRYGSWSFANLDSLARRVAARFDAARDFGGANVPIDGGYYAAYAGDQWRAGERLSLTTGLRAEVLAARGRAPYNAVVDTVFGRRTDETPRRRVHLSPRVGFTWDPLGTGRAQLRGGAGLFTGRPPAAWLHAARYSHGVGIGTLSCGPASTDLGPPPPFAPDHGAPPTECANGVGLTAAPGGDVDLLDRELRMAQTLRGALAYDRRLPLELLGTVEVLLTRSVADFVFVNLNLEGPQAVDQNGRVLYGTVRPDGRSTPARRSGARQTVREVVELRNTSRNSAYQLSARLTRGFSAGTAATAHYTFSRVRDVQTPLRTYARGVANWSSRAVSGRHDDLSPGISLNDIPHRIVLAGAQRAPWRRWRTELSFQYVGESGGPFTYLHTGVGGRGDLNADGSNANDPIYVPRTGAGETEVRFAALTRQLPVPGGGTRTDTVTAAQQREAFEHFIERTPCLRRQRGRILKRNSCREPWSHTTIASLRQGVPVGGRTVEAQLDVYNVLNLLKRDWGHYRVAVPALLEHVAQIPGPAGAGQPIFQFRPDAPRWTTLPAESSFQLQLGLRYRF